MADSMTGNNMEVITKPLITKITTGDTSITTSSQTPSNMPHPDYKPASGHNSTRPCKYCTNKKKYQPIIDKYLEEAINGRINPKTNRREPIIPFIEELALKLSVHRETILEWSKDEVNHAEFSDTFKTVFDAQRLRLQQRVIGRHNPSGAIFLLKANHGMIETEKQIHAGDSNEPLEIRIVKEKRR